MTMTEGTGTPRASAIRTALMARALAGALVIGLVASLFLHARGGTEDHYTPPTTPGDRAPLRVGETAPDFTLPNATGDPVSLKNFRGKPTIILFFRTFG